MGGVDNSRFIGMGTHECPQIYASGLALSGALFSFTYFIGGQVYFIILLFHSPTVSLFHYL